MSWGWVCCNLHRGSKAPSSIVQICNLPWGKKAELLCDRIPVQLTHFLSGCEFPTLQLERLHSRVHFHNFGLGISQWLIFLVFWYEALCIMIHFKHNVLTMCVETYDVLRNMSSKSLEHSSVWRTSYLNIKLRRPRQRQQYCCYNYDVTKILYFDQSKSIKRLCTFQFKILVDFCHLKHRTCREAQVHSRHTSH